MALISEAMYDSSLVPDFQAPTAAFTTMDFPSEVADFSPVAPTDHVWYGGGWVDIRSR